MRRDIRDQFDVVVVGGGPAGLAAAAAAAECGLKVALADDNLELGGQIWRAQTQNQGGQAGDWRRTLDLLGVQLLPQTRVFDQLPGKILCAEQGEDLLQLAYEKLILATGARERFLPFPGWTLANVMGAGGLQALVKSGLSVKNKRVVVAGTGPLLVAVAAFLRQNGAQVVVICEQASGVALARFGYGLLRYWQKLGQVGSLARQIIGVRFLTECFVLSAHGREVLEEVVIGVKGRTETIACDYLAVGFHLVPNTELACLLGCQLENGYVAVDEYQQTSKPAVFCAGEPTGIGGLERALLEGKIAGYAVGGRKALAKTFFPARMKLARFTAAIDRAFALRPELRKLTLSDTIVCRCEDVSYQQLEQYDSWRAAKLETRCGMGACQGRICGPITEFLLGWSVDWPRPPIWPVTVEHLGRASEDSQSEHKPSTAGHT
jgi:NADPH-dependent 2,4-dienoyl-CoA reductase/sulfur reductase-like enzyme